MIRLRKVHSNDLNVARNRRQHLLTLRDFKKCAEELSFEGGNVKKSSSKRIYYSRFLLYLNVLYEKIFQEDFGQLYSFDTLINLS